MRAVWLLAGTAAVLGGCGERPAGGRLAQAIWRDSAPHASGIVTVNGVRVNYLDWGGSGPALLLVHGLGASPHIFDDLAPAFTDRYRVVAYARRGHGRSEQRGPYDGTTLAEDLRQLMDSLGIVRASLVGWSMGGNEITRLAATYPDRVDRIVYLDAAYDWSEFGPGLETFPVTFDPDSAALSSFDRFRTWHLRTWFPDLTGTDTMRVEAHLRQLVRERPGGGGLEPVPAGETLEEIMATSLLADRREYPKVRAPALAIYSETFLSTASGDSARIAAWERDWMVPFRAASKARVRRELAQVEIVDVPGTHADFVFRSREQVVAAMRRFLGGAAVARGPARGAARSPFGRARQGLAGAVPVTSYALGPPGDASQDHVGGERPGGEVDRPCHDRRRGAAAGRAGPAQAGTAVLFDSLTLAFGARP